MTKVLTWDPMLKNEIYCSTACGFDCLKVDFDKATTRADQLAAVMGKGWKPKVWENMAWHWEVVSPSKHMRITGRYDNHFDVYIGRDILGGITWSGRSRTLRTAIRQAIKGLLAESNSLSELYGKIKADTHV